jgi:hypothetical protein
MCPGHGDADADFDRDFVGQSALEKRKVHRAFAPPAVGGAQFHWRRSQDVQHIRAALGLQDESSSTFIGLGQLVQ